MQANTLHGGLAVSADGGGFNGTLAEPLEVVASETASVLASAAVTGFSGFNSAERSTSAPLRISSASVSAAWQIGRKQHNKAIGNNNCIRKMFWWCCVFRFGSNTYMHEEQPSKGSMWAACVQVKKSLLAYTKYKIKPYMRVSPKQTVKKTNMGPPPAKMKPELLRLHALRQVSFPLPAWLWQVSPLPCRSAAFRAIPQAIL